MRRVGVALVVALAVLLGPVASASMEGMTVRVSIAFSAFAPEKIDVVAGDTVRWTNDSVRAHTVNADDDSYDSPRLVSGDGFSQRFEGPGVYPYHCRLHPFMRGEVDAYVLLLDPPRFPASPGRPYPLTGRSALPTATKVDIEADTGTGFQPVARTTVKPDGRFTALVTPTTTGRYRAVSGDNASPPVDLIVLDHTVTVSPSRRRTGFSVLTSVTPAAPGAPVVLQLLLRDRFGWWPVARARLGPASSVRLFARPHRRVPARVLLTLPDGATPLAISSTFALGPAKPRRTGGGARSRAG